jgi:hypothetical protein
LLRFFILSHSISLWLMRYCIMLLLVVISSQLPAQIKWDGEGGDVSWSNPLNWSGDIVPGYADDILLDNSFVTGSYTVNLPLTVVIIKTLSIKPAPSFNIQVTLAGNLAPAFIVNGHISIYDGGVFVNASTLTAGAAIEVYDSLRIYNGGHYIHATRSAHTALVSVLSKAPGTELGLFEFDVPGGPYTFTATNRTYGSLMFSATASGGSQVYNTIGSSALTINGDAIINAGTTINFDLDDNIFINRHFIQHGGIFNIAAQANATTVYIKGNINQQAGTITETAAGYPAIELNGVLHQYIFTAGNMVNSVSFRMNNVAGATLLSNCMLPFNLSLLKGNITTNAFLLTLAPDCTISTDSATGNSFINGRLRKEGLVGSSFFFPVGKAGTRRWLALKNATGHFTVEFFRSDPRLLASSTGPGIDHISRMEYWTVEANASPSPAGTVELSFDNVNSGGVTNLGALRVVNLVNNRWDDVGNNSTTGVVGIGSVASNHISFNTTGATHYFTLASSESIDNPLPQRWLRFTAQPMGNNILFNWQLPAHHLPAYFELQAADNDSHFTTVKHIPGQQGLYNYSYNTYSAAQQYRLKMVNMDRTVYYSNVIAVRLVVDNVVKIVPAVVYDHAMLQVYATENYVAEISIVDMYGKIVRQWRTAIKNGVNNISLKLSQLPEGVYVLSVNGGNKKMVKRFVKQ